VDDAAEDDGAGDEAALDPADGDDEHPATSPTARNKAAVRTVEEITRRSSPLPSGPAACSGRVDR
jgi:hypothetical protein